MAAIIGGLASYPVAAAGSLLVGLLESTASFWASAYKEVIVFTLIPAGAAVAPLAASHHDSDGGRRMNRYFLLLVGMALLPVLPTPEFLDYPGEPHRLVLHRGAGPRAADWGGRHDLLWPSRLVGLGPMPRRT